MGRDKEHQGATVEADNEPYIELLRNVPEVMRKALVQAEDAALALAWLQEEKPPDETQANGLHPARKHLTGAGTKADGTRWVQWDNEQYANTADDITGFLDDTELNEGPSGYVTTLEDQLAFRKALVVVLGAPDEAENDEMTLRAGTHFAAIEYAEMNETASYQGTYRLDKDCGGHDEPPAKPADRVWLNAAAERVIAKALT